MPGALRHRQLPVNQANSVMCHVSHIYRGIISIEDVGDDGWASFAFCNSIEFDRRSGVGRQRALANIYRQVTAVLAHNWYFALQAYGVALQAYDGRLRP